MAHDHDHHSHTLSFKNSNRNAFVIGICLNLLFVLAEVIAGLFYKSMALLTDAGHNAGDVASLVLSLVAFWIAKKGSNAVYTYGYKKTTVLAALINAVVLFIAIGVLGYESIVRLFHPEAVQGGVVAWVAAVGILINAFSAFLFYRGGQKELNARSAYVHLLGDALVSVGVVIAGILIKYLNWYWLDPAVGLVMMVVIFISTWGLLRDSFKMTIDAVPAGVELDAIKQVMLQVPHVKTVSHVHVWPLSTTENALTAHVVINENLSFEEKLHVIAEIKHQLEHNNIHHSTIELGT